MEHQSSARWVHIGILGTLLLNALWILGVPCFPTLDGWTHLHTARMMLQGLPDGVYCPNPDMVPNRAGHLVLAGLQIALPPLVAERLLLSLIVLGIGYGAYALVRALGGRSPIILLVLPFTVNFLVALGFHNFLLGLGLALLLAAWWIALERVTYIHYGAFIAATFLLFYTHTTALVLFLMLCGTHELMVMWRMRTRTDARTQKSLVALVQFLLAALPTVALFLIFNAGQGGEWGSVDRAANLRDLIDQRSLTLYGGEVEAKFVYAMKFIVFGALLLAIFDRSLCERPWRVHPTDLPLLIALLLLVLYFILPDSSGYASYITVRLQLMAMVLLIVWIAARPLALHTSLPFVAMALLVQYVRLDHFAETMAPLAERQDQLLLAADQLPEGAIVLPISTEDNWLLGHASSLLAVERDVVLLDNYECNTGYFPLVWCPGLPEALRSHIGGGDRCLDWLRQHIERNAAPRIDRIVLIGYGKDSVSCGAKNLRDVLSTRFAPGYANAYARVYERR